MADAASTGPALEPRVQAWQTLPRRLYLDTSALQEIQEHGATIWEGEEYVPTPRGAKVAGLEGEVYALRDILHVNERAGFEFVVTKENLREVAARHDGTGRYLRWVLDVQDTWLIQSSGLREPPVGSTLAEPKFGSVSVKDKALLQAALDFECEAFLTLETKLPKLDPFMWRATGLRILRPTDYWALLRPWAPLYY